MTSSELPKVSALELDAVIVIGRLDRALSEFLLLVRAPNLDAADAQTCKHHADDLISAGNTALEWLNQRLPKAV